MNISSLGAAPSGARRDIEATTPPVLLRSRLSRPDRPAEDEAPRFSRAATAEAETKLSQITAMLRQLGGNTGGLAQLTFLRQDFWTAGEGVSGSVAAEEGVEFARSNFLLNSETALRVQGNTSADAAFRLLS